jgi:hypothetical protein
MTDEPAQEAPQWSYEAGDEPDFPDLRLPLITDAMLKQWESSAEADAIAGTSWNAHPLAVIAVVRLARKGMRLWRDRDISDEDVPSLPSPQPLDVERLARAIRSRYGLKESEVEVAIFLRAIIGTGILSTEPSAESPAASPSEPKPET